MDPIPFTLDNLAQLQAAMATGVARVRFADREQEYIGAKDMMILRNLILQQLTPGGVRRQLRVMTSSGW